MQNYFKKFRDNTIGNEFVYKTPYGEKALIYADWIASGRLYRPIEERLLQTFGPYVGNTHTETSETGTIMTKSYHLAHKLIKKHVNAGSNDVIITTGFGMTGVIVKFQRMLGLKSCGKLIGSHCIQDSDKPVVFLTHMEHHSNQTSWYETIAEVVVLEPDKDLLVDPYELRRQLEIYKDRKFKIGSFSACSNVTGIGTPYHQLAKIMHEYGGVCFIDFAASAPYANIDMHPADPMEKLDAIFFSPHKFLGGPGASGVLVFDKSMYKIDSPDQPGGGTVEWTNPWGDYKFIDDIEVREDGGTPGFLQAIKSALAIEVKNEMGVENIHRREKELTEYAFKEFENVPGLNILAENVADRLGIISFYMDSIHFNLVVKLLSDRYGVQVRGGCACAGTYGHYLLNVSHEKSDKITTKINYGDLSEKPGWIRLSLHPTMTDGELETVIKALHEIRAKHRSWGQDYNYDKHTNEFRHISEHGEKDDLVKSWFKLY
ncbi:MAG: aminotransferase class V-fold PLP-dependent enzyme [Bacteroidetes bacterium]|nr:aminotransferase class V-fold PLP-dependent enzyme [Bacteroidota bacterium]